MTDRHPDDPARTEATLPPALRRDMDALRDVTRRDMPALENSLAHVRHLRPEPGPNRRFHFMPATTSRAGLVTVAAVAVLALALLVVPLSYDHTTGDRVTITLAGAGASAPVQALARTLGASLKSTRVGVDAAVKNGDPTYTFTADVPRGSGIDAAAVAHAFTHALDARGYHATAAVAPIVEHVSGSAFAYVRNLVIRVKTDGKTAAQIEAEIRQRLAEAQLPDAQVSVTDAGNKRSVTLSVQGKPGQPMPEDISLQLTDGKGDANAHRIAVRESRLKNGAQETLRIEVEGASATPVVVDIANPGSLSDAALAAAVREKLAAAGVDLDVTATNGRVTIQAK